MALYASFNAWYQQGIKTRNERQAINYLRKGIPLWEEYCAGEKLRQLHSPMKMLVELTQREPLSFVTPHWRGEVEDIYDLPSLLEYWYRVRCLVMHGAEIAPYYVYLAYETLNIFMDELISSTKSTTGH